MSSVHLPARRRLFIGAIAAILCGLVIGQARAVHPGSDAGLGYATPDELRVKTGSIGTSYALPIGGASDLAWSPGGRYLAYTVPSGDAPGLYVTDGAGCFTDRLTTEASDRAPAFDGASLYFTRADESLRFSYVLDGALMPGNTAACNPSMPIAAVAERATDNIVAHDMGTIF